MASPTHPRPVPSAPAATTLPPTPPAGPGPAPTPSWKPDWPDVRRRFTDWWHGRGFLVGTWGGVRRSNPRLGLPDPGPPADLRQQWEDLDWRTARAACDADRTDWPLDTLPVVDPWLGPGSLALHLGSYPRWMPDTVWFQKCIEDPDTHPLPLALDTAGRWWRLQTDLIDRLQTAAAGRWFTGCPDAIEGWDILASLRGDQDLLVDMIERPAWVRDRLAEVDRAWLAAYDLLHARLAGQDPRGPGMFGWFRLWAPGRVAKVQCDGCSMFSPAMFREFVAPALAAQCAALDYSLYHLDGSQCLPHLDALLELESLTAIEWTPDPRVPTGGSPHWYDLYRRIRRAGKLVQVLGARADEIEPLLDAVGPDGIYFLCTYGSEREAEDFARVVARLRP